MENKKELEGLFKGLNLILGSVQDITNGLPKKDKDFLNKEMETKKEELAKSLKDLIDLQKNK